MKTIAMAISLLVTSCEVANYIHTNPICAEPASVGEITTSCEDGVHYRCSNYDGTDRYPNMPCDEDDGQGGTITCVKECK